MDKKDNNRIDINEDKCDIYRFARSLTEPVQRNSIHVSGLYLGNSGTHYDRRQIEAEGFLRQLWAAGPLAVCDTEFDFSFYSRGILTGCDPDSPGYWGDVSDYDQLLVEMASLALTLVLTRGIFWDTLHEGEQNKIWCWLNQINTAKVHDNNWVFFRVMVNAAFSNLSLPFDQEAMDAALDELDTMYLKDGWYMDGNEHQMDYYIAWAFHFYGLVYAAFMKEKDPERSARYIERAKLFAQDFVYWFDDEGAAVPFGRSLTYRFAQSAFWSACVFADVEAVPWAEMKYILTKNLQYWEQQTLIRPDGMLSIGYGYENLYMSESYNGPGSPYWAFKTFLILAVPDSHPFWKTVVQKPARKIGVYPIPAAKMLLSAEPDGNAQLYPTDQLTRQAHAPEKYSKFVYSSLFGFSVRKDSKYLESGAYDNTLAVACKGDEHYFEKEECDKSGMTDEYVWYQWNPMDKVKILSYIVPVSLGHIRIHLLKTERALQLADGGYAVRTFNGHKKDYSCKESESRAELTGENGTVQSVKIRGFDHCEMVFPDPNTNLLYPNSAIPTVKGCVEPGFHILISGHFGSREEFAENPVPEVKVHDDTAVIHGDKKDVEVSLSF